MFGILLHVVVENIGKYLASIMDDSAIICEEVRESYDEEIKRQQPVKRKLFIFYLHFY